MDLSIAMITCFRPEIPYPAGVEMLRGGGFRQELHLFAEPMPLWPTPGVVLHPNAHKLGGWENWRQAATWLVQETSSRYLMLVEDDVQYARITAMALEQRLEALPDFDLLSLYYSVRDQQTVSGPSAQGWFRHNRGWDHFGNLALVFDRQGGIVKYLQAMRDVKQSGHRPLSFDRMLFQWFQDQGKTEVWTHYPSFTDHVGHQSRLWHKDHPGRQGAGFDEWTQ